MKFPIAEVTWLDASSSNSWKPLEAAVDWEPYVVKSVGHLIRNDKKVTILAISHYEWDMGSDVTNVLNIPKEYIKEIKILRKGKK